ncbi:DUF5028 domain-containing protein [Miniphocaeibacter massiliensis]|uniref:DUF5028 domain-containing protein n=1 Tax=Miniphocaeibacter massiliensis TaxID=2041841 RepID=UPI000C1BABCF|nr:DUF5028 domain-containing protein [Miniphocaeibacter massiliensis]
MKKKIIILVIGVLLISLFSVRVYAINKYLDIPKTVEYEKGEVVPYGKDGTPIDGDVKDGYTVKVLESEIVSKQDLIKKYKIEEEGIENILGEYFYNVRIIFKNESNKEGQENGIGLLQLNLTGINYYAMMDSLVFEFMNPDMPGDSFSIKEGEEVEVVVPFGIIPSSHDTYEGLLKNPPKLQITGYPNRKLISVN